MFNIIFWQYAAVAPYFHFLKESLCHMLPAIALQ
jgi:hypothetical protein